jgi:hypothetical protein
MTQLLCHSRLEFALAAIKYEIPDGALLLKPSAEIKPIIEAMGDGKCVIVTSSNHYWQGDSTIVVPEVVSRYYVVQAINRALTKKRGPKPGGKNETIPLAETQYAPA